VGVSSLAGLPVALSFSIYGSNSGIASYDLAIGDHLIVFCVEIRAVSEHVRIRFRWGNCSIGSYDRSLGSVASDCSPALSK